MSVAAETDPPRYVESIPTATAPVVLPDLLPGRGKYLAGVITGGALLVVAAIEFLASLVVMVR